MNLELKGRIDSTNANQVENELVAQLNGVKNEPVVLDASALDYISSAGLRIILRLKKSHPDLSVVNVSTDVYDIFEMTGFTEMMTVKKAYRVVSIEGCEVIGQGANGTIYRIDRDNVVKVYKNPDALDDIQHEREVAKLALILGVPTAISYDIVKVGNSYGSVFELLNATSFSKIIQTQPDKFDWCVNEFVKMMKTIHGTVVPNGKLPDMKKTALGWAEFMKDYLPKEAGEKLISLIEDVPQDNHMIHGDYHTQNLQLQNDEVLLIDMDTLSVGNPIFELGSIYNAFVGFSEINKDIVVKFQGFDSETAKKFWRQFLAQYIGTTNERKIEEVENKARIIGYARLIRRSIRRKGLEQENTKKEIEFWTNELIELLNCTDTLLFSKNELLIEATTDNLEAVQNFVNKHLEETDCPPKTQMQIGLAVEEIFVNIAHYAYAPRLGSAMVRVEVFDNPLCVCISFIDNGVPYDPLAKQDPDITLSANDRQIGGLGIFMTKKIMDDISYEYKNGQNILKLKKNL